jgi:hypothetical protein
MDIIVVYTDNHTKPMNTMPEENAELLNVKSGGTRSYHSTLNFNEHNNSKSFIDKVVKIFPLTMDCDLHVGRRILRSVSQM